jgi:hypothetical protein
MKGWPVTGVDDPGDDSLPPGSVEYFCSTSASLKLRHLTP